MLTKFLRERNKLFLNCTIKDYIPSKEINISLGTIKLLKKKLKKRKKQKRLFPVNIFTKNLYLTCTSDADGGVSFSVEERYVENPKVFGVVKVYVNGETDVSQLPDNLVEEVFGVIGLYTDEQSVNAYLKKKA